MKSNQTKTEPKINHPHVEPTPWRVFEMTHGLFTWEVQAGKDGGARAIIYQGPSEGTARLVAAAPELLEACKYAVQELGPTSSGDNCWKALAKLQDAIAKAEGR